jgi:hypothetical protein
MQWSTNPTDFQYNWDENTQVSVALPITLANAETVTSTVIAGQLPPGVHLINNVLVGVPFEVAAVANFKFVIRARTSPTIFGDRTFTASISGADVPAWVTPAGRLPVGPNSVFYVADSTYLDFQLSASDTDMLAGQSLVYSIEKGELPPGLRLSDTGRITGWIAPALVIPRVDGISGYGTTVFDKIAYDYADAIVDDTVNLTQSRLSRNYEFVAAVSDGINVVTRKFLIYVIADSLVTADSTSMFAGNTSIRVDSLRTRVPIWSTLPDLGTVRANNYTTLKLDTYPDNMGTVVYSLNTKNPDNTPCRLPPGMRFVPATAEVVGIIQYQSATTQSYKFSVTATRIGDLTNYLSNSAADTYSQYATATSIRTFTVSVVGELDSILIWSTASDLGTIDADYLSMRSIVAASNTAAMPTYQLIAGQLPIGLSLAQNGEIVGIPRSFTNGISNIVRFDDGYTTFDATFDRLFRFTVRASITTQTQITREFTLTLQPSDGRRYSDFIVKPNLSLSDRALYKSIVSDATVFNTDYVYRTPDSNFGIKYEPEMLVYAGIETKSMLEYSAITATNHARKRFIFGETKTAIAKETINGPIVYEVVYVTIIDPLELTAASLPEATVLESGQAVYPSSISIWRRQIAEQGWATDPRYMPPWMRTIQPGAYVELGYVPAIVLGYFKPGTSEEIMLNIKNYTKTTGFNFNQIGLEVDRYIVSKSTEDDTPKQLIFNGVTQ